MTHSADRAPRTRAAPVRTLAIALFLLVAAIAVGCVYRINIQQGNFLDPKAVEQLTVGMTRSQVRYLLGTPMVPNAFDTDRWDYFFYYKTGRTRKAEQAQIVVYFEDDKVSRIERPRGGSAQVATTTHTEKPAKAKEPAEPLPPPPAPPSSTAEQLPPPPASPRESVPSTPEASGSPPPSPPESAPSTPEVPESPPASPPESAPSTPEASESPPSSPPESASATPEPTDPSPP